MNGAMVKVCQDLTLSETTAICMYENNYMHNALPLQK